MNPVWNNVRVLVASVNSEDHVLTAFSLRFATFMIEAAEHIQAGRIHCEQGCSMPLDYERSRLAQAAADPENNFTHLYMHDSDMPLQLAHLEKLLSRNVDIVSGTYFMGGWQPQPPDGEKFPFPCVAQIEGKYVTRPQIVEAASRDELIEVHGTGAGALLVTSGALRKVGNPAFQFYWAVTNNGGFKEGEDYHFCRLARSSGLKITMDPTVIVDHFKMIRVGLNLTDMNNEFITTFNQ